MGARNASIRARLGSPHLRGISYLASGAALAQLMGLAVTPIITRLYQPSDYGSMALYGSIVAIVSSIACARYETAIPLPAESAEGERDAVALVRLALASAVFVSGVALLVVVLIVLSGYGDWFGDLGIWTYAIPLGILVSAWSAALGAYATRRRQYGRIARVAPLQKTVAATIQIGAGLLNLGRSGLMLGAVVTPFVGLGVLSKVFREGRRAHTGNSPWDRSRIRRVAADYSDFPRVSTWFALLNALAWNIQAVVVAHFYSVAEVGQYALAFAMISLPTTVIITGVNQVYLRECAARTHDPVAASRLARQTLGGLVAVSIPLFLGLWLASRYLFGIVFGPEWIPAGAIASALIPLTWARFLTTSLTSTFNVYRRQGLQLIWQIATLTATLTGFVWGGANGLGISEVTWVVSGLVAPMYLILIPMVFRVLRAGPPGGQDATRPVPDRRQSSR